MPIEEINMSGMFRSYNQIIQYYPKLVNSFFGEF